MFVWEAKCHLRGPGHYLDYEALATGYGIPAMRTGRPDELAVAVKEALASTKGPQMIIVDVAQGVPLRD
jgi:thiamine pyrophosphate-dependent acetolactate synthase large subunit-like protein